VTRGEEIANSITHGVGAVLSIAGLVTLIVGAALRGNAWHIVTCSIYGATLVLLYVASTLYHALPEGRAKHVFLILDHSAIYLLIAGTYTPLTLVTLRGGWGWALFGFVWGLAVLGIVFKSLFVGRLAILSTIVYILMGWCALIAIRPLLQVLPWNAFLWLLAGGLAYTLGVIFFASKYRYAHTIWHLFVLAGSACHFVAVYKYVLPVAASA
jgi:hemolysin III